VNRSVAGFKRWLAAVLVGWLLSVAGCVSGPEAKPAPMLPILPARGELPSYEAVAEAHNARLASFERLWTRAGIRLLEPKSGDEGTLQVTERGDDSKLILVLADRVALAVGKLGQLGLWLGSNEARYWLLQLRENKRAFVGRHERFGERQARRLSLPVPPRRLPTLLGLTRLPLPPEDQPEPPVRVGPDGTLVIQPPGLSARMAMAVRQDAAGQIRDARPVRVDLLDAGGQVAFRAFMRDYEPVETEGLAPARWPEIPTDYRIQQAGHPNRLEIRLKDPTDGRGGERIKPAVFDLDRLLRAYDIDRVEDLDAPSPFE